MILFCFVFLGMLKSHFVVLRKLCCVGKEVKPDLLPAEHVHWPFALSHQPSCTAHSRSFIFLPSSPHIDAPITRLYSRKKGKIQEISREGPHSWGSAP